jgi:nucleoid-associated protein YgaU
MNKINTPRLDFILPLFLLSGLLAFTAGCSTSETKSDNANSEAVSEPAENTAASEGEKIATPAEKTIRVKASHPKQYTVKKGDTLWDISSLFLQDPWYWPEIWQNNTQIKNPHLIFPGDVLTLIYVDGQPQILVNEAAHRSVVQSSGGMPVKKLSPSIRTSALQASIPSIPGDAIRQFLTKPRVVTKEQLENAPRIVGSEDTHLILGSGSRVYIRGELDKERVRFTVFKPGDKLIDPVTEDLLGYEAKYAGEVHITEYGDPASGDLTYTEREVLIGDRLLPEDKSKLENLYFPHVPDKDVDAQVISLYDALFGVAQYQIIVLNKGESDGMEVGHLLASFTQGKVVRDRLDKNSSKPVKLPNERSGLVMIFKTFDRVSYALTLESKRVIHKNDYLHTPKL